MGNYKAVIGLEMHCELKSNMKVFSNAINSYDGLPNINVSPIDMALPGTLPIINMECIKKAIKMSLVLGCKQPEYMYFDRKNYYYPDLPKGYQITQTHAPIGTNGKLIIDVNGKEKTIEISDIHLEEDSARLNHYTDYSLIDYNRAGVPLLECVTAPCMNSADEAIAFLETMRKIYQYCDLSDADTKKGQIRCDVNVSIMDEFDTKFGTKVEIKNVNSFANVREVINYEIKRQSELKNAGRYDEVEQETRRYDEEKGITVRMRSKADAIDYKYFVDPNIPRYKLTSSFIDNIRKTIPMLPRERKTMYVNEYGLSEYDANVIVKEKDYADYFEECVKLGINPKTAANYLTVLIIAFLNKWAIELKDFYLKPDLLKQIIDEQEKGNISSKQAKEIFNKSLEEKKEPKNFFSKENNQITDIDTLNEIIEIVLNNNKDQIIEYKNGKTNLFAYFVGQVMKESKGKANPSIVTDILNKKLN